MGFDDEKLKWQEANIKQTPTIERVSRGMLGQSCNLVLTASVLSVS